MTTEGTGPTITDLSHVQITVPKGAEPEARRFYCEFLGLREIRKPAPLQGRGGLWLQLGAQQVHIGTEDGVDRRATRAHVGYQVRDLEGWRGVLAARGIAVEDGVQIPGWRRFEFRDPFGNRIEMLEPSAS